MPIGAEIAPGGGVHFRVWAPRRRTVEVELRIGGAHDTQRCVQLEREPSGYFSGLLPQAHAGARYRFRLDGEGPFPDPASRYQPEGPHGPSEVIDPSTFEWTDREWPGPTRHSPVLYELHVGTFTTEGTWTAAIEQLPALAELGVTIIEIMPLAEFSGRFGWGYDGVDLFAPSHLYGIPDDVRRFVDRAHSLGLGVILDVVYNHFGPDGNYVTQFSDTYFSPRHHTDWGNGINFDGEGAAGTREFLLANAAYWIREFHMDGLRVDATQNIYDESDPHILTELTRVVRDAAHPRDSFIVAENEPQDVRLLRPLEEGGHGMDAAWNDDWHHSAMVALSGRDEAYYTDYAGAASEFVAAAKFGFLYQGQYYRWQKAPRGVPGLDLAPSQFVHFLENHDQVANSFHGDRLQRVASVRRVRAMTALLLLGPQTPMLFQGQEFGASTPFLYFADLGEELMRLVGDGRARFLSQFRSIAAQLPDASPPDPGDPATFVRSKLDHTERMKHAEIYALHRDLIALRRSDPVLSHPRPGGVDGAALSVDAFVLRFFGEDGDDRLLVMNLGRPLHLFIMPEPLLAPPRRGRWNLLWSSDEVRYGGLGQPPLDAAMSDWTLHGDSAVLLHPALPSE